MEECCGKVAILRNMDSAVLGRPKSHKKEINLPQPMEPWIDNFDVLCVSASKATHGKKYNFRVFPSS